MATTYQPMKCKLADTGDKEAKKWKLDCKPLEIKYKAIKSVEAEKKKMIEIAAEFGVKPNTLSTWLKQESIKANYESYTFAAGTKKMRAADYGDVEKALDMWFHEAGAASVPIP